MTEQWVIDEQHYATNMVDATIRDQREREGDNPHPLSVLMTHVGQLTCDLADPDRDDWYEICSEIAAAAIRLMAEGDSKHNIEPQLVWHHRADVTPEGYQWPRQNLRRKDFCIPVEGGDDAV